MMPLRVLMIGPIPVSIPTGGGAAFERALTALRTSNMIVEVLDTKQGLPQNQRPGRFQANRALRTFKLLWLSIWRMRVCQVLYIHLATSFLGAARDAALVALAKVCRIRVVAHCHNGNMAGFLAEVPGPFRSVYKWCVGSVDEVIVLGETFRNHFDFVSARGGAVSILHNCPARDITRPASAPKALGRPTNVLYMSNLFKSKGYMEVLAAAARLKKTRGDQYHFYIAGTLIARAGESEAALREEIRAFVADHGLQSTVTFCGSVIDGAKIALLERCHVMVLPTYYEREGLPVCLIEALAFGLPVLSTNYRAIPEIITSGYNGDFILADGESVALGIEKLCADPEAYRAMSSNCLDDFNRRFSFETFRQKLTHSIVGPQERN